MIKKKAVISRNQDCISTSLDNNLVILNTNNGKFIKLNYTAQLIWENIEDSPSYNEMIGRLNKLTNLNKDDLVEVELFLHDGCKNMIIEITENS